MNLSSSVAPERPTTPVSARRPSLPSTRSSISSTSSSASARSQEWPRSPHSLTDCYSLERRRSLLTTVMIDGHNVSLVTTFDRPAPLLPRSMPSPDVTAAQLSEALHEQAPDLLPGFARRFAQDIGYELLALHNAHRRAYLGLSLTQVGFFAPASFRLLPCTAERPLKVFSLSEDIARGVAGFAPEEQQGDAIFLSASLQYEFGQPSWEAEVEKALKRIDTFSWAASVAAFAIGRPLVPLFDEQTPCAPWVQQILAQTSNVVADVLADPTPCARSFWGHFVLDTACQRAIECIQSDSSQRDEPHSARSSFLTSQLAQWGDPWPGLQRILGSLLEPLLDCFELQSSARPLLREFMISHSSPQDVDGMENENS